jgi:cyclic pyranopterin monophosphate synthase
MKTKTAKNLPQLSHVDAGGQASMVDVSSKPIQYREATAQGEIRLQPETLILIESHQVAKGNVLATARVAGILAAKRTDEWIPLCHSLPLTHCAIDFTIPPSRDRLVIVATAKTAAQTGVEMEALTAVAAASLTIYDMCKAVDHSMRITDICLLRKIKK